MSSPMCRRADITYVDNFDHAVPDHEPALRVADRCDLVLKKALPRIVFHKLHGRKHLLQASARCMRRVECVGVGTWDCRSMERSVSVDSTPPGAKSAIG